MKLHARMFVDAFAVCSGVYNILAHFHCAKAHGLLHAVAMKMAMQMATNDQSTFRSTNISDVNQKTIRAIVSGMVSVVDVLEHYNYTMPDYPVKRVELIHVKLKDDNNGIHASYEHFFSGSR